MARHIVVFDLDGTLLRGQTVCQLLATECGFGARMDELELESDVPGILAARREIVTWFHGRSISELQAMLPTEALAPGAEAGCNLLRNMGFEMAIASITWEFGVKRYAEVLGIGNYLGTNLSGDWEISDRWPDDKAEFIRALMLEHGVPQSNIAAVGDSWGDVPMLCAASFAVCVGERPVIEVSENSVHVPDGSILDIAEMIIAWAEKGLTS